MRELRQLGTAALLCAAIACNKVTPPDQQSEREGASVNQASTLRVGRLRWDGNERPIGVLRLEPRLEWQLSSSERGQQQIAYQVLVASDAKLLAAGKADVWDSGKVRGSENINVLYGGGRLQARQRGVWTVRVWDERDRPSAYAAPSTWEVGPWDEEVEGDWIGRASLKPAGTENALRK
jgi:alpha-L-rhamnosidase